MNLTSVDLYVVNASYGLGSAFDIEYILIGPEDQNLDALFEEFKKTYVPVKIEPLKKGASEIEKLNYLSNKNRFPETTAFVKWLEESKGFTQPETINLFLDT